MIDLNLGSFLLIFILLIQAIKSKDDIQKIPKIYFWDALVITLTVNSGFFLKVAGYELSYADFTVLVFILTALFLQRSYKTKRQTFILSVLLLFIVFFGWFAITISKKTILVSVINSGPEMRRLFNYETDLSLSYDNLKRFLMFVTFIVSGLLFSFYKNSFSFLKKTQRILKGIIIFQVVIGILDFFFKEVFHIPLVQIVSSLVFGISKSQDLGYGIRLGGFFFVQGFMREPTHYATSFIPGLTLISMQKKSTKEWILILSSFIVLFLSTSFLGFAVIFYVVALLITDMFRNGKKFLTSFITIIIIVLVVSFVLGSYINRYETPTSFLEYYMYRFRRAFFEVDVYTAEPRVLRNKYVLKKITERPLLGYGLGTLSANGLIPTLVVNLGVIGALVWFAFLFSVTMNKRVDLIIFILWFLLMFFTSSGYGIYTFQGLALFLGVALISNMRS